MAESQAPRGGASHRLEESMTEESEGQLFVFTMGMYLDGEEPARLTMSTNLADLDAWAQVFDTLRLNWERERIREDERVRLRSRR